MDDTCPECGYRGPPVWDAEGNLEAQVCGNCSAPMQFYDRDSGDLLTQCPDCGGFGLVLYETCDYCGGRGLVRVADEKGN